MKNRSPWRENDITLGNLNFPITGEQKRRSREVIDKMIQDFKRRLREAKQ